MAAKHQPPLIGALLGNPDCFPHPVGKVSLVETHVSWVLLTGPYAYKIKKPLDLGFLDYSTLDRRRFFCEEEIRLNRCLAPELYLDVVSVTGREGTPRVGGEGGAIEYAVRMREFFQEDQLDRVLAREGLAPQLVDRMARQVAAFHSRARVAPAESPYGTPEAAYAPMAQNFAQIRPGLDLEELPRLKRLEKWSETVFARLEGTLAGRKRAGFVRECHGDLHLANMALFEKRLQIYDGIEFNASLRWIDVISDLAFLVMDLEFRGQRPLAWRCLNRYLEVSGDYAGLALLDFYRVYRALVRAKVACIRAGQGGLAPAEAGDMRGTFRHYAALAEQFTRPNPVFLVVMHGFSGAGKTAVSQSLLEACGGVRIRSDVERKRLAGLAPEQRSGSALGRHLYSDHSTNRTYNRLVALARTVLRAGFPVIVDATFLKRWQRDAQRSLAGELEVPVSFVDVQADERVLEARIAQRAETGEDASEAGVDVLHGQMENAEPLSRHELAMTLSVDGENPPGPAEWQREIRRLSHRLAP